MLFNSWTFLFFYALVLGAYSVLRRQRRAQNVLLLVASYVFYGWWDVRFLSLIALSTYVDYCTSLLIDRGRLTRRQTLGSALYLVGMVFACTSCHQAGTFAFPSDRAAWWTTLAALAFVALFPWLQRVPRWLGWRRPERYHLFWCVLINLGVLGVFKYLGFFADSFLHLWTWLTGSAPGDWVLHIVLPVGISFFTFQTLSHAVDVYRKEIRASASLLDLATYVAFFPQLVAGPIERGAHLLPQFQRGRSVDREAVRDGLWLILWGLYKKVVVADNVARIVNATFGPYDNLSLSQVPEDGLRCLVAVYAFAIQIYCDFSGYTDMARGTAKLLGFDIMLNFDLPYVASTPSDFWRRWHISLSSWLRDYLYIPLGGNRKGRVRTYTNLLTTMVLGGLWHGAAWTFVLWGTFHGAILVVYRLLGIRGDRSTSPLKRWGKGVVMFHLVCLGWLLFRAQNLPTVGLFLQGILRVWQDTTQGLVDLRHVLFYAGFLIAFQVCQGVLRDLNPLRRAHWFVRVNVYVFLVVSLLRLAPHGHQEFIYFAF